MDTPCEKSRSTCNSENDESAAKCGGEVSHLPRIAADTPRLVIRGESSSETPPPEVGERYEIIARSGGRGHIVTIPEPRISTPSRAAITDWLNCTFPLEESPEALATLFHQFTGIAGDEFAPMAEVGKGFHGWRRSFDLGNSTAKLGIGGQRGKALLSLPGTACARISLDAWPQLVALLHDHYNATITRWDGAVDDYIGARNVEWAVEQYLTNGFSTGGNRPSCSQQGDWIGDGETGRTFYVGKRKNGKLLRVYEKGKQLGDPTSPWVRFELELHNRDRIIPWDVLLNPGGYVAGAFPCLSWITEDANRIRTTKNSLQIAYDTLTFHARRGYGRLINVMLKQEGSAEKVVEKLIREGIPARLDIPIPPEMTPSPENG